MIINENLEKNLLNLQQNIDLITKNNSLTDLQIESFLMSFERARYNILAEIKLYNQNVEYDYEKIKTIDDEYKANFNNGILKIYVPEVLPSYKSLKNQKTHTHKKIHKSQKSNSKILNLCIYYLCSNNCLLESLS